MGKKVFVVGCGAVGTSLASALHKAGRDIIGIYDTDARQAGESAKIVGTQGFGGALPEMVKDADTVVVTTPDSVIEKVVSLVEAEELYSVGQVWIHCSGHLTSAVFAPIANKVKGVATMHPAFVFPPKQCTVIPEGVFFAVGGNDAGLKKVREHAALLKGKIIEVPPEKRPAYHAAMVMASNYMVTQLSCARNILMSAGIDESSIEPMLFSLAGSALEKARTLGISHSLSGPVRRGDVSVVKDHLDALKENSLALGLYVAAGKEAVALAAGEPGYCQDTAQTLNELLDKYR
ncbi:MAG: DUF2520 domain-containing protein [Deltaproteobacteria bacterium]|nr:DUF2520 domain-containing protein [Deltaproteobacteria bacterium]MBN2672972.1 DUF2520 domain-containing protein [Deltaproteobacteria bacterium]